MSILSILTRIVLATTLMVGLPACEKKEEGENADASSGGPAINRILKHSPQVVPDKSGAEEPVENVDAPSEPSKTASKSTNKISGNTTPPSGSTAGGPVTGGSGTDGGDTGGGDTGGGDTGGGDTGGGDTGGGDTGGGDTGGGDTGGGDTGGGDTGGGDTGGGDTGGGDTGGGDTGGGDTGGGDPVVSVPSAPTITTPSQSTSYSTTDSIVIAGACDTGLTVTLGGDVVNSEITQPALNASQTCVLGLYNFSIEKSDGSYTFSVKQTNSAGDSLNASVTIIVDTIAPSEPAVRSPAVSPYVSGNSVLNLNGTCEIGSSIILEGDSEGTLACVDGVFSVSISKTDDATYSFSLSAKDTAGLASESVVVVWTKDTSVPESPTVTSPAQGVAYNSTGFLTVMGGCTNGYSITLNGDVNASEVTTPLNSLTMLCTSLEYRFDLDKTVAGEGTYEIRLQQENPDTEAASTEQVLTYVFDATAPNAPTITSPPTSPYMSATALTVEGPCELGARVYLTGDEATDVLCTGSSYSFTVDEQSDGTYNYSVYQVDPAGNTSSSSGIQWQRNSSVPATPTITNPSVSPFYSNANEITVGGSCVSGLEIRLQGDVIASDVVTPTSSLSQFCVNSGYSFKVRKVTDGTYNLAVAAWNGESLSPTSQKQWRRDTSAPVVTLTMVHADPNPSFTSSFTFTANETGATFECRLDGASWQSCTSPRVYQSLTNVSHTFEVRGRDLANNVSSAEGRTWSQQGFKTIALYHMDNQTAGTHIGDSSSYTDPLSNDLTDSGTSQSTSCKFNQCRNFVRSQSDYMRVAHTGSQAMLVDTMTVEGFFNFNSFSNNQQMELVSKASSGNLGFRIYVRRYKNTSSYKIGFVGSLNGTTTSTVESNYISSITGSWRHIAVTWNRGTVTFFYNGTVVGTKVIGTAGSARLFSSTAQLELGRGSGTNYLNGKMDELRISQIIRYGGAFTSPSAAFTAD
ncbi:MAG: LamG-like jellyroll fold domain-containing protein [Oligoflexales bacterium]